MSAWCLGGSGSYPRSWTIPRGLCGPIAWCLGGPITWCLCPDVAWCLGPAVALGLTALWE